MTTFSKLKSLFGQGPEESEKSHTHPDELFVGLAINISVLDRTYYKDCCIKEFLQKCESDSAYKEQMRKRYTEVGDRPAKRFNESFNGLKEQLLPARTSAIEEPYLVKNDKYVVVPSQSGVSVYKVIKIDGDNNVTTGPYAEWSYPAGTPKNEILYKIERELKDVRIQQATERARQALKE